MKLSLLALSLIVFVSGCSTTSDAMNKVSKYYDQSVDVFFRANGMPQQAYQFENGERMYRWSSAVRSIQMPATTTITGSVGPHGQIFGNAQTTGGYTANLQCVIDIVANKDNKIISIVPVVDTWGSWETSRCNEVLR